MNGAVCAVLVDGSDVTGAACWPATCAGACAPGCAAVSTVGETAPDIGGCWTPATALFCCWPPTLFCCWPPALSSSSSPPPAPPVTGGQSTQKTLCFSAPGALGLV